MPSTTTFRFGDVVLVPFPFTDQSGTKRRPAVIVRSDAHLAWHRDLVILAVTSRIRAKPGWCEVPVMGWRESGLLKPSLVKPVIATIEGSLIVARLGALTSADRDAVRSVLRTLLG